MFKIGSAPSSWSDGTATIISGATSPLDIPNPTVNVTYHIAVYVRDGGYQYHQVSATSLTTVPIQPAGMTCTKSTSPSKVAITIDGPPLGTLYNGVKIRRDTGSAPTSHTSGTAVVETTSATYDETPAPSGTWYYRAFGTKSSNYATTGPTCSIP